MELTSTLSKSGALYLAHNKKANAATRRFSFFRRYAAEAILEPPDIRRRTFADAHVSRRFHPDNGR